MKSEAGGAGSAGARDQVSLPGAIKYEKINPGVGGIEDIYIGRLERK